MNIVITKVVWDSDGETVVSEDFLPMLILDAPIDDCDIEPPLLLDAEANDIIADIISDETGWCHKSFEWNDARDVGKEVLARVKIVTQYEG